MGLGSENKDLPDFPGICFRRCGARPISLSTIIIGVVVFFPSRYQGVKLRNSGDPVLYLKDPERIAAAFAPQHAGWFI
jgi:hypothetical protein